MFSSYILQLGCNSDAVFFIVLSNNKRKLPENKQHLGRFSLMEIQKIQFHLLQSKSVSREIFLKWQCRHISERINSMKIAFGWLWIYESTTWNEFPKFWCLQICNNRHKSWEIFFKFALGILHFTKHYRILKELLNSYSLCARL